MLNFHAILHPTDFSACSEPAFRLAYALARDQGARLVVLHVHPPPLCHAEVVARRQDDGYYEQLEAELRGLKAPGGVEVDYLLKEGNAVEVITEVAAEYPCGLIVLGTHGRSGLGRVLLGSVAESVLREASCPVLTVRAGQTSMAAARREETEHAVGP
jgi:universal stress protein A